MQMLAAARYLESIASPTGPITLREAKALNRLHHGDQVYTVDYSRLCAHSFCERSEGPSAWLVWVTICIGSAYATPNPNPKPETTT